MPDEARRIRPVISALVPRWSPGETPDYRHFGVYVETYIGWPEWEGIDLFTITACTPSWLMEAYKETPAPRPLWSMSHKADYIRGLVLMVEWNEEVLRQVVDDVCEECAGPTWPVVASRLCRYFPWEYEYRLDGMQNDHPDGPLPPWRDG